MTYGMGSPTGKRGGVQGDVIPKGYRTGQLQQFTPDQLKLFGQLFSQVSPDSFTSKLASGDQSSFDEVEAPALRQFGALQGNIASRFSGMGLGGRHGSGFQNTINQAGSDFAQQLQSQRMGYQRQALQDLMGMSQQLLGQQPYERYLVEKQQKKKTNWGGLIGGGIGAGIGLMGGPFGALAGATAGHQIGEAFT